MIASIPITLARVFLKMHLRDRQAIVFSLLFPMAFMLALASSNSSFSTEPGAVSSARV